MVVTDQNPVQGSVEHVVPLPVLLSIGRPTRFTNGKRESG